MKRILQHILGMIKTIIILLFIVSVLMFGFFRYKEHVAMQKLIEIVQVEKNNCITKNKCSPSSLAWEIKECALSLKEIYGISAPTSCAHRSPMRYYGNDDNFVVEYHLWPDDNNVARAGKNNPVIIEKYYDGEFSYILYEEHP